MKKWWVTLAASLTCLAIYFAISFLLRSMLIIQFGVRLFHAVQLTMLWASFGFIGASLILVAVENVAKRKCLAESRREQKLLAEQRAEEERLVDVRTTTPEAIRDNFERILRKNPKLDGVIEKCLDQMDSMDYKQARLQHLIDNNDALFATGAVDVLDQVETHLCGNFRNIINVFVAGGCNEGGVKPKSIDMDEVNEYLEANEAILNDVQELISQLTTYINDRNTNKSDLVQLDAWNEMVRDFLKGSLS